MLGHERSQWESVGMREALGAPFGSGLPAEHEGSFPRNQSSALSDRALVSSGTNFILLGNSPTPESPAQGSEPPSSAEF